MGFLVEVVEDQKLLPQAVVPIRFARATEGESKADTPDLDTRGFLPGKFGSARGPVIGVMSGRTIRVRLVRDRLAHQAKVFVTADDPSIVEIVQPSKDLPLNTNSKVDSDTVYLKGGKISKHRMTIVRARWGSSTGPVLGELSVRVYPRLRVPVQFHGTRINESDPFLLLATQAKTLLEDINQIYAQVGIEFCLRSIGIPIESYTGFLVRGGVLDNDVTLPNGQKIASNEEYAHILSVNPNPEALNVYTVEHLFAVDPETGKVEEATTVAIGWDPSFVWDYINPSLPEGKPQASVGVVTRLAQSKQLMAHVLAHEFGHVLGLDHYGNSSVKDLREDLWAHRNLMHPEIALHPPERSEEHSCKSSPARMAIGYGHITGEGIALPFPGDWIGTKAIPAIHQSHQWFVLRDQVLKQAFLP